MGPPRPKGIDAHVTKGASMPRDKMPRDKADTTEGGGPTAKDAHNDERASCSSAWTGAWTPRGEGGVRGDWNPKGPLTTSRQGGVQCDPR